MNKDSSIRSRIPKSWSVWLVLLASVVMATWPGILFPLAFAYVRFCAEGLQNTLLFYHFPPYLAGAAVAGGSVMLIVVAFALQRQLAGHQQPTAFAYHHSQPISGQWADLAARCGVSERLHVIRDAHVYAFCAGWFSPRIYVSAGLLRTLIPSEVEAVVRHEAHHVWRRDPLRLLLLTIVQSLMTPLPAFATLADRFRARIEIMADRSVLERMPVEALAGALVKVARAKTSTDEPRLTVTEFKPSEVRVAALLGKPVTIPFQYRDVIVTLAVVLAVTATSWHLAQLPFPMIPYCNVCPSN